MQQTMPESCNCKDNENYRFVSASFTGPSYAYLRLILQAAYWAPLVSIPGSEAGQQTGRHEH